MTWNVIVQNVWFSTQAEAERLLAVNDGILWDSFHASWSPEHQREKKEFQLWFQESVTGLKKFLKYFPAVAQNYLLPRKLGNYNFRHEIF